VYKVLIADDEILSRIGVRSLVDWELEGFVLVGEAEHGGQALDLARQLQPDVIITDIKMPYMSGIELIRTLSAEQFPGKFIVLSSYDDFEYVKEAMKFGAVDYFLKLGLQPDQLREILRKVKGSMDEERSEKEDDHTESFKPQNRDRHVLKEKLLRDLIFGWIQKKEEVESRLRYLDISFPEAHMLCLVVQVDSLEVYDKYDHTDLHIIEYAYLNIVEEIVSGYQWGYAVATQPKEIAIVFSFENRADAYVQEVISHVTNAIKGALKKYLNCSVSIGVSGVHASYAAIKLAYKQALEAVNNRFRFPRGSTIRFEQMAGSDHDNERIDFSMEMKALTEAVDLTHTEQFQQAINQMIDKIKRAPYLTKAYLQGACSSFIFIMNMHANKYHISDQELWNGDPYKQISRLDVADDFVQWFKTSEELIVRSLDGSKAHIKMIVQAKQFIHKYYDQDLSLEVVAEHLNISANYLSNLFKKDTGEKFIDFVTNVRIHKAKELLMTGNYKVYEVGVMVGFQNEHYFSRVFKKITGISPTQYRI